MQYDVFISYSSKDSVTAQAICHELEDNHIRCWIAPRDIPVGSKYATVIINAIKSSKAVVLVFSERSAMSPWVESEINIAFSNRKPIIPYKIDKAHIEDYSEFYLMLNNRHWIEAYPDFKTRFMELVGVVKDIVKPTINSSTTASLPTGNTSQSSSKLSPTPSNKKTYMVNGESFTMVHVAGGTFTMGPPDSDSDADSDEKPAHQVTLSSYSIGETQVTQALWQAVMGSNPSHFKGNLQCPVEQVTWNDCQEFIRKLNSLTGTTFRLPTEAEWEYAARGGSQSRGYKYSGSDNIGSVAWYTDNSSDTTHPVKGKQPNELGLYDMSGNVWEWCADWFEKSYYAFSLRTNPKGPSSGYSRVLRGGSWYINARYCRVAHRNSLIPDFGYYYNGLRLAQ